MLLRYVFVHFLFNGRSLLEHLDALFGLRHIKVEKSRFEVPQFLFRIFVKKINVIALQLVIDLLDKQNVNLVMLSQMRILNTPIDVRSDHLQFDDLLLQVLGPVFLLKLSTRSDLQPALHRYYFLLKVVLLGF